MYSSGSWQAEERMEWVRDVQSESLFIQLHLGSTDIKQGYGMFLYESRASAQALLLSGHQRGLVAWHTLLTNLASEALFLYLL